MMIVDYLGYSLTANGWRMITLIQSNQAALAMNNPLLPYAMTSPEWSNLVVELPNPNVYALPIYNHLLSSIPSLLASVLAVMSTICL
jgi:hypothetical protein